MFRSLKVCSYPLCMGFSILPSKVFAADSPSVGQWQLLALFEKGGAMIYPILFSSVLMLGIAIERGYSLRRKNIISSKFLKDLRNQWDWKNIQDRKSVV